MLKTVRRAFQIEDIRKRILYTFAMLIVVRLGSQLPTPGVDPTFIQDFFASQTGDAFNFFEAFTGGSFSNMSIFALSITPYITSSIIMQLLTIAIPKLEEMQKEGEDGRKKIAAITRYVTVALALIESIAMAVGFGRQGLLEEYEKRNRELRRVRRFLREKGQKTAFEIYLQQNFDGFWEEALRVTEEVRSYREVLGAAQGTFFHGDFQHHNVLFSPGGASVVNFEKFGLGCQMRDLYLFLRKLLEKTNWSAPLARGLLDVYGKEKKLTAPDFLQLYYRFAYPEKFWKIANFYYNTGKAWIPGRNMEKLQKLVDLQKAKNAFLEQTFSL